MKINNIGLLNFNPLKQPQLQSKNSTLNQTAGNFTFSKNSSNAIKAQIMSNVSFKGDSYAHAAIEKKVGEIEKKANFILTTDVHYIKQKIENYKTIAKAINALGDELIEQGEKSNFEDITYSNGNVRVLFVKSSDKTQSLPLKIYEYDINGNMIRKITLRRDKSKQVNILNENKEDIYEYNPDGTISAIAKGYNEENEQVTIDESLGFKNDGSLDYYNTDYVKDDLYEAWGSYTDFYSDGSIHSHAKNVRDFTDGFSEVGESYIWEKDKLTQYKKDAEKSSEGNEEARVKCFFRNGAYIYCSDNE